MEETRRGRALVVVAVAFVIGGLLRCSASASPRTTNQKGSQRYPIPRVDTLQRRTFDLQAQVEQQALGEAPVGSLSGEEESKSATGYEKCFSEWSFLTFGASLVPGSGLRRCIYSAREAGAPPLSGPEWGERLRAAANRGQNAMLEVLLAAGAPVDATAHEHGLTALMLAAWKGHALCAADLLEAGADAERKDATYLNYTALMYASSQGHVHVVKVLLAAGADVDAANAYGWTALLLASRKGHAEVAEELLAAHADANARDRNGDTALHDAAKNNHADVVRVLLRHGADKSLRNKWGKVPLDYAQTDDVRRLLTS